MKKDENKVFEDLFVADVEPKTCASDQENSQPPEIPEEIKDRSRAHNKLPECPDFLKDKAKIKKFKLENSVESEEKNELVYWASLWFGRHRK